MASIIFNSEHVLQSAIAAAFSVSDVNPVPYKTIAEATETIKKMTGIVYVFADELIPEAVDEEIATPSAAASDAVPLEVKKLIGTIPIAQLGAHSVPKSIITFLNKHATDVMAIYLGMLETEEYSKLYPFAAFFRLFSSLEFDVRSAGKFIRRAMIRDRHATHLASEIPTFMHKGALFVRYGPYVDRRVAMEKKKEDAPESIVVFADNTGFSNGADVSMRLIVYGKIPGCLAEAVFNETIEGGEGSVGSLSMASWATMMKGAKVITE